MASELNVGKTKLDAANTDPLGSYTGNSQLLIGSGNRLVAIARDTDGDNAYIHSYEDTVGAKNLVLQPGGGSVGIGGGTPSADAGADELVIAPASGNAGITINTPSANGLIYFADAESLYAGYIAYNHADNEMTVATAAVPRLTIDNAGSVMVGTTNDSVATQSTDLGAVVTQEGRFYATTSDHHDLNRTADGETIRFRKSHVQCGSISVSSGATAFNTSSDYRLKENLTPLTGALDRLDSIPVYNFNFKAEPDRTVDGFLAHEVSEFVPEAITGTKDEMESVVVTKAVEAVEAVAATYYEDGDELPDGKSIGDEKTPAVEAVEAVAEVTEEQPKYQGIDQSKLVPLLVAAVKELKAKVTALESA